MPGPARQLAAYAHCLEAYGPDTCWLGFIDVDEFLLPYGTDDLRELLTDYEDAAALGVNWVNVRLLCAVILAAIGRVV